MKRVFGTLAITMLFACHPQAPSDTPDQNTGVETSSERPATNPLKNVYFGDLHVHTGNSFDAFIFNVKATPDHAYRYAKGETIKHPGRFDIRLDGPPLDFYAVTDHGEYLGILRAMKDKKNPLSKTTLAKEMSFLNVGKLRAAFGRISASTRSGNRITEIYDQAYMNDVWQKTVASANAHNDPGTFTTFAGYEFSSVIARNPLDLSVGGNLHRNVIFQNQAPEQLYTTLDSPNPENLWAWMEELRRQEIDSLAIPHNSNVSDGRMFALKTYDGEPLDKAYAELRSRNEPLVEITQIKGTSETHPSLAPNDEWADFEIYEDLLNTTVKGKVTGSYIREALGQGLELQQTVGYNPFRFGFIGSSDTHVAGSGFTEQNYWGKMGFVDGKAKQRGSVPAKRKKTWNTKRPNPALESPFGKWSASGLAGIWAQENTRESLFDAMRRKETFATSGPRISVRFFGGYDFSQDMTDAANVIERVYAEGVPMGGKLEASETAPTFFTWAVKDPRSAPLDRIQIVKVWFDGTDMQQFVYDVACSVGQPAKTTHRCVDNGARVDIKTCNISQGLGATELKTLWSDPDFKPELPAAYYVRVLENPTCRWSTWDAIKAGVEPNPLLKNTVKERAWSSPIWYEPEQGG